MAKIFNPQLFEHLKEYMIEIDNDNLYPSLVHPINMIVSVEEKNINVGYCETCEYTETVLEVQYVSDNIQYERTFRTTMEHFMNWIAYKED